MRHYKSVVRAILLPAPRFFHLEKFEIPLQTSVLIFFFFALRGVKITVPMAESTTADSNKGVESKRGNATTAGI